MTYVASKLPDLETTFNEVISYLMSRQTDNYRVVLPNLIKNITLRRQQIIESGTDDTIRQLSKLYSDLSNINRETVILDHQTLKLIVSPSSFDSINFSMPTMIRCRPCYKELCIDTKSIKESIIMIDDSTVEILSAFMMPNIEEVLLEFPFIRILILEDCNAIVSSASIVKLIIKTSYQLFSHSLPNMIDLNIDSIIISSLSINNFNSLENIMITDSILNELYNISGCSIRKIVLDSTNIKTFADGSFDELPNLTDLSMTYCNIKELRSDIFKHLYSLDTLTLDNNNISDADYLTDLNSLKLVSLQENNICNDIKIPHIPSLVEIRISLNPITKFSNHDLGLEPHVLVF